MSSVKVAHTLTGSRAAADRCCRCRHTRIRHLKAGTGPCAGIVWVPDNPSDPNGPYSPKLCDCKAMLETGVLA